MKNKLSKELKILEIDNMLGNVTEIFLTTFLAAYFYKISVDNIKYLSIYNVVGYIVATIAAFTLGNYIKRKNKIKLYRFGTIIKALYVFLIIILKEKIISYVYLIAFARGLSTCASGFTFNMIESEQISNKERTKYFAYKTAGMEAVSIIVPIFLGAYITFKSYEVAAILILIFSIVKIALSFFIKNKNIQKDSIDLKGFVSKIQKDDKIKKLYFIEFLKGLNRYGVMQLVISLLIIYELNTEFELGALTSVFSIMTIVSMALFARYYNRNNENKLLNLCAVTILLSFCLMIYSINIVTIIIYNIVYYTFINILINITEKRLFNYSNIELYKDKYNTEYFLIREVYLNIGRIVGYSILLIVGIMHNMNILKILLLLITTSLIGVVYMSKKLNREESIIENNIYKEGHE